jgi:hypothetical protein
MVSIRDLGQVATQSWKQGLDHALITRTYGEAGYVQTISLVGNTVPCHSVHAKFSISGAWSIILDDVGNSIKQVK